MGQVAWAGPKVGLHPEKEIDAPSTKPSAQVAVTFRGKNRPPSATLSRTVARQVINTSILAESSIVSPHHDFHRARAFLAHATGNAGKHIVRVSADQADRADDYDEIYSKHDGIFRNVSYGWQEGRNTGI